MNGEDLYNGVTEIRDDQIAEAQNLPGRKTARKKAKLPHGRRWLAPAAAVLAVVMIAGFFLNLRNGSLNAYAVSTAEYPKQAKYSAVNDTPVLEARQERYRFAEIYAGTMENFTSAVLPGLLSGAGTENRICSPVNVYMALSMLAELTEGETQGQLLTLLDCDTLETVRTRANALWNANYVDDGTVTSIPANSLWLSENLEFVQKTLDTLSDTYYASSYQGKMGTKKFDGAMQSWINQNTRGRLKEQSSRLEMDPETILALVSTLYYRAKWSHEFQKGQTSPEVFHAPDGDRTVDFMHETSDSTYYWGETFSAASKYLRNSGNMWFILPDEGVSVDQLLTDGTAADFLNTVTSSSAERNWEDSKYLEIHLSLPKFDVSSDLDLTESLKALGVTDVFDPNTADFSPMLEEASLEKLPLPPYISYVKHAARVTIDEEGCEAASYVVLPAAGAGAPPDDEVDFILNRPFLFAVTGPNGALLFVGIVNQP